LAAALGVVNFAPCAKQLFSINRLVRSVAEKQTIEKQETA
jgi:hypothetical protein